MNARQKTKEAATGRIGKELFLWSKALLITVAFCAALYFVLGQPAYETNDDVLMAMAAAGVGLVDTPDPHILYSHFAIGFVLNILFSSFPNLPWYGLYLVSAEILALLIIVYLITKNFSSKVGYFLAALALFSALRPLMTIQFTSTSSLVGIAASLLIFASLKHYRLTSSVVPYATISVFLFALAAAIRPQGALLALGLSLVFLVVQQTKRFNLHQVKIGLSIILIAGVMVFAVRQSNVYFYEKDPAWQNTLYHCDSIWGLINTEKLDGQDSRTKEVLNKYGWSPIDVSMFKNWYFLDEQFNDATLRKIEEELPFQNIQLNSLTTNLVSMMQDHSLIPIFATIALCCFWLSSSRLTMNESLMICILVIIICGALVLFAKCPPRIYVPLWLASAIYILFYASPKAMRDLFSPSKAITVALLGLVYLASFNMFYQENLKVAAKRVEFYKLTSKMSKFNDRLFITWVAEFPYESVGVFDNLTQQFKGIKVIGFNSMLSTPTFYKRLTEFGIKNVLTELDNKNVLVIASDATRNCLVEYLESHYQKEPKFTPVINQRSINVTAYKTEFVKKSIEQDASKK